MKISVALLTLLTLFSLNAFAQVDIPDANLRAAIENALGVDAGEPITKAEMETLIEFGAGDANIIYFDAPKADVNADGVVNILDLVRVASAFGEQASANPKADVNTDGVINILDLVLVANFFDNTQ